MSGHSKWSQIKHKKAATDAKKSKIFSKMAAAITIAAKKGGNPNDNPTLRMTIDKARSFNMPNDNIERAIKRGAGELEGIQLEEILYEAYGPGGIAIVVKAITDNKNRTLADIKHILSEHGGKFAESGSVKWLFEERGVIVVNRKSQIANRKIEELELLAIETGAEDFKLVNQDEEEYLEIYTKPEQLMEIKKILEEKNITAESASIDLIPKNETEIICGETKEKIRNLFEALGEQSEIEEIYSNLKE